MAEQETAHPRVFWPFPGLVFVLIGMSLTIAVVTVTLATNDPSFGLEEDYFAKAVAWDETAAQLEKNRELGWTTEVQLSKQLDGRGERSVTALLADDEGRAIEGANVEVFCFHNARRKETIAFDLVEIAPGRYTAGAAMTREGQWTLRLRVTRGDDVFTSTETGWAG
ncbi:MAG: FixH family protein [Phycisphaerales bacterium]|nr:FixH family protein [Phycisphaerales bacterium]MCB9836876.1 FixH family protein [Phycisphaera sp.]